MEKEFLSIHIVTSLGWWFFSPVFIITILIDEEQRNRFLSIFKNQKHFYCEQEISTNVYNSLITIDPNLDFNVVRKKVNKILKSV
jgi:hypothetical protein